MALRHADISVSVLCGELLYVIQNTRITNKQPSSRRNVSRAAVHCWPSTQKYLASSPMLVLCYWHLQFAKYGLLLDKRGGGAVTERKCQFYYT
jgi:hypothetical protein